MLSLGHRYLLFTLLCFSSLFAGGRDPLADTRAIIFDMDGVLRRGFEAINGAGELIDWMQSHGMVGVILTNECRYTEKRLRDDLNRMGVAYPESWPIYTAAMAARDFVQEHMPSQSRVHAFAVGEDGLKEAMSQVVKPEYTLQESLPADLAQDDELVLVVGSVDRISVQTLEQAMGWIRRGAKVIVTCPDSTDPAAKGSELIGMPSHMLHMIRMQAPCNPYSVGKPHPFVISKAMKLLAELDPTLSQEEILFVGDSLDTDIRTAFEAGLGSALVLTGNTRKEAAYSHVIQPDLVIPSVLELKHLLEKRG